MAQVTVTVKNQTSFQITVKARVSSSSSATTLGTVGAFQSRDFNIYDTVYKYVDLSGGSSNLRYNGYSDGSGFSVANKTITVTLYSPQPTYYDYSCDYSRNGGSGGAQDWSSSSSSTSFPFTVGAGPTRDGYRFDGWKSNLTGAIYFEGDRCTELTSSRRDIVLTAQWAQTSWNFIVGFQPNGGTGGPSDTSWTAGSSTYTYTVPDDYPTRTHYTFKGWTLSGATTGTRKPGERFTLNSGTTIFTAVWEENPKYTYKVNYDANGGAGAPSNVSQESYATTWSWTVSSTKPTKTDFEFDYWKDENGTRYDPGDGINLSSSRTSITLTAQWKTALKTYSVVYNANGGTGGPGTVTFEDRATSVNYTILTTPKPTKSLHTFEGWSTDGKTVITSIYIEPGTTTLYAVWKAYYNTVTVQPLPRGAGTVYVRNDTTGERGTSATGPVGSRFYFELVGIDSHYEFEYLYLDADPDTHKGIDYSIAFNQASDHTVYAKFKEKTYRVDVQSDNADEGLVRVFSGDYHDHVWTNQPYTASVLIEAKANVGYDFMYWRDGTNTIGTNPYNATVTGNITYTAYFKPHAFTINVSASPANGGTVTGGGTYFYKDKVTLEATPVDNYSFLRWSDGDSRPLRTITVSSDLDLVAYFVPERVYEIKVVTKGSGQVYGAGRYAAGEKVDLSAMANPGAYFLKWGDGDTNSSKSFTATKNATYTAYFTSGGGGGGGIQNTYFISTYPLPDSHAGWTSGDGQYIEGSQCTISAYPSELHRFAYWDTHGGNPDTFFVYDNENIGAVFERDPQIYVGNMQVTDVYLGSSLLSQVSLGSSPVYLD